KSNRHRTHHPLGLRGARRNHRMCDEARSRESRLWAPSRQLRAARDSPDRAVGKSSTITHMPLTAAFEPEPAAVGHCGRDGAPTSGRSSPSVSDCRVWMRVLVSFPHPPRADMRVNLRRGQALVPQQFLYGAEIGTAIEQMRCEAVPQSM